MTGWYVAAALLPILVGLVAVVALKRAAKRPDPDATTYLSRHDQNYTAYERRRDWT